MIDQNPSPVSNSCSSPDSAYHSSIADGTPTSGYESPESVIIDVVSSTPRLPALPTIGQTDAPGPIKRYLCQRCLNHNDHHPRKGHKPFCRYASCDCQLCIMVDERRRLNNAICRQVAVTDGDEDERMDGKSKVRDPKCARCSAHGKQNRLRGHKKRCEYSDCVCSLCKLVDERRDLMAKQIKLRRQQKNELQRRNQVMMMEPIRHNIEVQQSMDLSAAGIRFPNHQFPPMLFDGAQSQHFQYQPSFLNTHPSMATTISTTANEGILSSSMASMPPHHHNTHAYPSLTSLVPCTGCIVCFQGVVDTEIKKAEKLRQLATEREMVVSQLLSRFLTQQQQQMPPPPSPATTDLIIRNLLDQQAAAMMAAERPVIALSNGVGGLHLPTHPAGQ